MGRGSYLGGGTLVGPRSWSSFDPAQDNATYLTTRGKKKQRSKAFIKQKPKGLVKQQSIVSLKEIRLSLLHNVILSEIRKLPLPKKMPRPYRTELTKEVTDSGGLLAWAIKQPEYEPLREKKLNKRATTETGSPAGPANVGSKNPNAGIGKKVAELTVKRKVMQKGKKVALSKAKKLQLPVPPHSRFVTGELESKLRYDQSRTSKKSPYQILQSLSKGMPGNEEEDP
jgi:hypothetical protein